MIAVSRFRVSDEAGFVPRAQAAADFFAGRPGCRTAELVRNLDESDLWALVSRWADVGSYRRAFNGYDAKLVLVPLLSEALDEPSAYAAPDAVGVNRPRGE